MTRLKIVADENIPALGALLESVADIRYLPGRSITQQDLQQADALIVRSITQVNAQLLQETPVSFVGTCTIGTDHIDLDYLQQNNISFTSAPGCNADAVVNYVLSCLFKRFQTLGKIQQLKIGVLGYGQVGTRLVTMLKQLSVEVIACDPFVEHANASASFKDILACDVISIHTPITTSEQSTHPTYYLFNKDVLSQLKSNTLIINAARGQVVDNHALLEVLQAAKADVGNMPALTVVLDVYDDEPTPSIALLSELFLSTSHIAGYSVQGKLRGTTMVVEQLFKHFNLISKPNSLLSETIIELDVSHILELGELVQLAYDIYSDSQNFQKHYAQAVTGQALNKVYAAELFDAFRKNYPQRFEWSFTQLNNLAPHLQAAAQQLGFKC